MLVNFVKFLNSQYTIASCGMMEEDVERLKQILDACPAVPAICLDVANGYSEHFVEFVKTVRSKFPEHIIMVCKVLLNKKIFTWNFSQMISAIQ